MQTFLPSSYSFSLDKLVNNQLREYIMHPCQYIFNTPEGFAVIIPIFLILAFMLALIFFANSIDTDITKLGKIISRTFSITVMTIAAILLSIMVYKGTQNDLYNKYTIASFKYPINSNLQVRAVNKKYSPETINDHSKYPYKLYTNNKVYLGQVTNGNFMSTDNEASATFNQYHMYIMKHHLAKAFSKQIFFKKDKHYRTNNGHTQWVLTNNKDLVLYLDSNSQVKNSKVIKDQ